MKPSSDIDLFTTTLPFPVLISLIVFLRRTLGCSPDPFRRLLGPTIHSHSRQYRRH
jgi:hypothetical protein